MAASFRQPTTIERMFNKLIAVLVRFGLAPAHMRLLEVRGRKSGKTYRTPVDLLEFEGKLYLVAPRGNIQWVRNAEAAGSVKTIRGGKTDQFAVRLVPETQRPPILKAYLDRFRREVQQFFSVPADSPVSAFEPLAAQHPVFELQAVNS